MNTTIMVVVVLLVVFGIGVCLGIELGWRDRIRIEKEMGIDLDKITQDD